MSLFKKLFPNIKQKNNSSIIVDNGKNNRLILFDADGKETASQYLTNLEVYFYGNNNSIKLYNSLRFDRLTKIVCSENNQVFIDKSDYIIGLIIPYCMSPYSKLIIGKSFSCGTTQFRLHQEPYLEIRIGNDCMFSENVYIKPSDGHTIIDSLSKNVINYPNNIEIGDHCWIGRNVSILKGSKIPMNSVVGIGSIYTKKSNPTQGGGGLYSLGFQPRLLKTA